MYRIRDLVLFSTGHWSHIVSTTNPDRTVCGKVIPPQGSGTIWDRQTTSEPGCHTCFGAIQKGRA